MQVTEIWIYPIKGMRGIPLQKAKLESEGFQYDRRWMLVHEDGVFLSQRSHPQLALFEQTVTEDNLILEYRGNKIRIPLEATNGDEWSVKVFDDELKGTRVSDEIDAWFSEQLSDKVSLVRITPTSGRRKKLIKGPPDTLVSFADGYPYLILGTASLDVLNSKLSAPLPMNRFRPNIVINTTEAHEEDSWNKITIGTEQLQVIKPCARCTVTTIDQDTAIKGKEPLITLATYRKEGNKIYFGANTISLSNGWVQVGDRIELLD